MQVRSRTRFFFSVIAAFFILASAIPALAILPEKQTDSYLKLSGSGRTMLPGQGQYIKWADQGDGNKVKRIKELNNSKGWRRFAEKAGPGWYVRWNTVTGTPHLAAGKPLVLPPWRQLTSDNINTVCMAFVLAYSDLLAIEPSKLRPVKILKAGGRWHVTYEQIHNNVPVYGSSIYMAFTNDDRLTAFGCDVFGGVEIDTVPKIGQKEALDAALADCGRQNVDRISDVTLYILPVGSPQKPQYQLCWKLDILQSSLQKKWQYFINAKSGQIEMKRNTLWYANVTGVVKGEYKPELGGDPTMVGTFADEEVSVEGQEKIIQSWDFNSDPGWTAEGDWAFGKPLGQGSGCGDPSSGYTGDYVYGYNLSGDYKNNKPVAYLTATPVDCSDYENVRLKFMRWLGVEIDWYDHAAVEVSNNGVDWVPVWTNPDLYICDGKWVSVSYDISEVAAFQPKVYVRWAMGPTDNTITFPGWSIDDVKIVAVQGGMEGTITDNDGRYKDKLPWKNSTVISQLKGLYCDINYYGSEFDTQFVKQDVFQRDIVNWTWDSSFYNVLDESNVYWHVNHIHQYYKQLDRDFEGMDYPVPAWVYVDMSNAYWDGVGIAFGSGDGESFDSFGLYAEVIYHEYTHGVTDKIYAGVEFPYAAEPGAMNEGWSDYFACALSPSQSPKIGEGGLLIFDPNGLRRLDNSYRRETDWYNEVHADSQMFSGSLWEAREAMGAEIMDSLVHFARYAHATTFEDYLTALLVEDASRYRDRDLSDGTPHSQAIFTAFGHHGIGGLQYLGPSIVVNDETGNHNGKLEPGETGRVSLTLSNGWANAKNVSAEISSSDPNVNITKAKAVFGEINYGEMADNVSDPFIISVLPDCPETHTVRFTLTITADGPYSYERKCLLYYNVAVQQLVYDDGQPDEWMAYRMKGGRMAVRMTPEAYPCYPTHIRLYPLDRTTITLMFWDDDDPNSSPHTVLGTVTAHPPAADDWYDVDITSLGLAVKSGSIYAGWQEEAVPYVNGFDDDPPYYERMVLSGGTKWYRVEEFGWMGNLMVRLRYATEPPLRISPPYEYRWCPLGDTISLCLKASNGTPPYHNWTALPTPPNYGYGILDSSLFAAVGIGQNWHEDDYTWSYKLPFSFPYYGTNYSSVNVSSNGLLDFAGDAVSFGNTVQEFVDNVRIAPLWDDLTTEQGDIFIDESISGQVAIRWQTGAFLGLPVNFAVVLFDDGRIRFDYGQTNTFLSPTVGISAGDGVNCILVEGYNSARSLTNAKSVMFTPVPPMPSLPAGIDLDPATGCLSGTPGTEGTYNVTFEVEDSSSPPKTGKSDFVFHVGQNPADLDDNCRVNLFDFSILGKYWLKKPCNSSNSWCGQADFDKNGAVNMSDLAVIAEHWLDGIN